MASPLVPPLLGPDPGRDLGLAALVLPGGGYATLAGHEGAPVARWLAGIGVAAGVLDYPVGVPHPAPLGAALETLAALRGQPGWSRRRIGVVGFSAGGHLAAMCCHPRAYGFAARPPEFAVLCYPVIAMDADGHAGCTRILLGNDPDEDARRHFSVDTVVGPGTPPAFLWHTADDASVPVANALRYAAACRAAGVPVELHVFEHGRHGLGLARGTQAAAWPDLCADWLACRAGAPTRSQSTESAAGSRSGRS